MDTFSSRIQPNVHSFLKKISHLEHSSYTTVFMLQIKYMVANSVESNEGRFERVENMNSLCKLSDEIF